ncbi:MAG: hypothetical protein EOP06_08795 [Proteobacteria bacterium]|nr:MAG: hypothetical protein EOP06_08795 [Pseudomonadota bacterium]
MNILEILKALVPHFSHFEDSEIVIGGKSVGFQTVMVDSTHLPYAGGFGSSLNLARRICAAEAIERSYFFTLSEASEVDKAAFLMNEFPSSCGFAAGFELAPTIFRAQCEAIERWTWSQWVDQEQEMPQAASPMLGEVEKKFAGVFDRVAFFEKQISCDQIPELSNQQIVFSAVIGQKGKGIFPGSRVSGLKDNRWGHGLLEAWRHLKVFEGSQQKRFDNVIDQRIIKFGNNGADTLKNLRSFANPWATTPVLRISKAVANKSGYHVHRSLCHDYVGWDQGDENRFIY